MNKLEQAVFVEKVTYDAIEEAIRQSTIATTDKDLATAGYENLIVYGSFDLMGSDPIILIRVTVP